MLNSVAMRVTVGVAAAWAWSEWRDPLGIEGKSLEWCAYTVIILAAPTLGSVVVKALDRALGTVMGGLVAVAVNAAHLDFAWLIAVTSLLAGGSVLVAQWLKKDYSMKLFVVTFVIIATGNMHTGTQEGIAFAISRTKGVMIGGALVSVLTVLMWPKAASTDAINSVRSAVQSLQQLQEEVWDNGAVSTGWSLHSANRGFRVRVDDSYIGSDTAHPSYARSHEGPRTSVGPTWTGQETSEQDMGLRRLVTIKSGEFHGMGNLPLNTVEDMEEMESRQELVIDRIMSSLTEAENLAAESASEMYAGSIRGWPVFLPGLSFRWAQVGWVMPSKELTVLGNTIRKIVRLYWSIQRAFQLGFDDELMEVVVERYPPGMLLTIQEHSVQVIQAILAAFPQPGRLRPASSQIELDKLLHFCLSVKELLSVGAGQRNAANEMLYRANSETQRTGKLQRLKTMTMSSKNLVPEEPQKAGLLDPGVSGDNACPQRSSLPDKREYSIEQALAQTMSRPRKKALQCLVDKVAEDTTDHFPQERWSMLDSSGDSHSASTSGNVPEGMFPNTPNGHIAKVRWYSFLFLIERLAVALIELHEDADDFLCKLPGAAASGDPALP